MGHIKTGGEEETKDTTDSLDMLIFGFWHLTQVKDMENILTSQVLPFLFYKSEAAAYWNCKSITASSSHGLFRDRKCRFHGLNQSIVKSLNAKLCEWKQALSPSMPHIPNYITPDHLVSSFSTESEEPRDKTHSYICSFNTGYSPTDTFLYKYR